MHNMCLGYLPRVYSVLCFLHPQSEISQSLQKIKPYPVGTMHAEKHVAQPPVKSISCANKKIKPCPVGTMHAQKHVPQKVTGRTKKVYVALVYQISMNLIC